jgi:hypothetical protein
MDVDVTTLDVCQAQYPVRPVVECDGLVSAVRLEPRAVSLGREAPFRLEMSDYLLADLQRRKPTEIKVHQVRADYCNAAGQLVEGAWAGANHDGDLLPKRARMMLPRVQEHGTRRLGEHVFRQG